MMINFTCALTDTIIRIRVEDISAYGNSLRFGQARDERWVILYTGQKFLVKDTIQNIDRKITENRVFLEKKVRELESENLSLKIRMKKDV